MFFCEILYLASLAAILRPVEGYVVTDLKILVYCKPWVSQLKLNYSDKPFGLATYIQTFKYYIRPIGDCKIHVTANENISA